MLHTLQAADPNPNPNPNPNPSPNVLHALQAANPNPNPHPNPNPNPNVLHTRQIMLRQRHTLALVRQQQQAALEADARAHGARLDRTPAVAVRLGRLVWALLLPLRSASYRSAREGVG